MIERKFTQETATITCPLCKKRGGVFFYSGCQTDGYGYKETARLHCSHCSFFIWTYEDEKEFKPRDEDTLRLLLKKFKEVDFPPIAPCRICGEEPFPSISYSICSIKCYNCGITVDDNGYNAAIQMWNKLMTKSE